MIPQIENQLEYESEDIEEVKSPSKTYKLNKNINAVKTTLGEKEVIEGSEIYIDDAGVQTASITEIQGKSEQETSNNLLYLDSVTPSGTTYNEKAPTITNGIINVKGNNNSSYNSKGYYPNGFVEIRTTQQWKASTTYYFSCKIEVISNQKNLDTSWFTFGPYGETGHSINYNSASQRYETSITTPADLNETFKNRKYIEMRIDGMELNISEISIKTTNDYTFDGYGISPSPEYPSEIHSVADDVNLLQNNATTTTVNGITFTVNSDGTVIANGTATAQATIDIGRNLENIFNGKYIMSGSPKGSSSSTYYMNLFKTENGTITSIGAEYGNGITTEQENDCYLWTRIVIVRGQTVNNLVFKPKIQKDTVATPYSPYNQGTVTIKQRGKNLFDFDDFLELSNATYSKENGIYTISSIGASYSSPKTLNFINGQEYTFCQEYQKQSSTNVRIELLKNGSVYWASYSTDTDKNNRKRTFTADNSTYTIRLNYLTKNGDIIINKPQLEFGSTDTTYEPYFNENYTFQTEPLRSLPNGVKDTMEDNTNRRTGEYIFDGTESWSAWNFTSDTYIGAFLNNVVPYNYSSGNDIRGICSHFKVVVNGDSTKESMGLRQLGDINRIYLCIEKNKLSSENLAGIKDWLSDNKPRLVYQLAEEVIEPLTEEQEEVYNELQELSIYNKTLQITTPNVPEPTFVLEYYPKSSVIKEIVEVDKIAGFVDDIEAIKQSAYHILSIERYSYIIYDDDYGVELEQYIGQNLDYIEATIQDTLEEALTQDERIIGVQVTNIEKTNIDCVHIEFVLMCDTGEIEMEVDINV